MSKELDQISNDARVLYGEVDYGLAKMLKKGLQAGVILVERSDVGSAQKAIRRSGVDWRELIVQIAEFLLMLLRKWVLGK